MTKALRNFVERAVRQFRTYEEIHRAKGTAEADAKAAENKTIAEEGEAVLSAPDFHAAAMRTAPPKGTFHPGKLFEAHLFAHDMLAYIEASRRIDHWKSILIYGAEKDESKYDALPTADDLELADFTHISGPYGSPEFAHAIMGIASEGGELIEHLLWLLVGKPTEGVGVIEETGDVDWFQELLADALNFPVDQSRDVVVGKLRERFPDKFTQELAAARLDKAEATE